MESFHIRYYSSIIVFQTAFGTDAVYGRLDVNVALNRPAFISSVYNDGTWGQHGPAYKGVDSNSDPVMNKPDSSCVHTNPESNPWFGVDLGAALCVYGVLLTARAETCGRPIRGLLD